MISRDQVHAQMGTSSLHPSWGSASHAHSATTTAIATISQECDDRTATGPRRPVRGRARRASRAAPASASSPCEGVACPTPRRQQLSRVAIAASAAGAARSALAADAPGRSAQDEPLDMAAWALLRTRAASDRAPGLLASSSAALPLRTVQPARVAVVGTPAGATTARALTLLAPVAVTPPASMSAVAAASGAPASPRDQLVTPRDTVFISLCFEGPDGYATAGGLGTRIAALTETLAGQGYETHLLFVGDPHQPGLEVRMDGKLHLARWCQWISRHWPHGVYDGEEHKLADYTASAPAYVVDTLVASALAHGKRVVILAEDWHTAEALCRVSDLLTARGLRERCVLLWNCNSLLGLQRVDFARLSQCATLTTVSRYMKHQLWAYGVNPLVVPNGIPSRYLAPVDGTLAAQLRTILQRGTPERHVLFKMARFDPDKRWLMTIEAAARLKARGEPMVLLMRGGIEAHGAEVLARAQALGLRVCDVPGTAPATPEDFLRQMRDVAAAEGADPAEAADIYHLHGFLPPAVGRLCYAAADATLANSGHEPFGLVGLEVMAAGGIAFTGSTGEDYAVSFENAIALETDDPDEIVGYLGHLRRHPELRQRLRIAGQRTARAYTWEAAIATLASKLGYILQKQQTSLA